MQHVASTVLVSGASGIVGYGILKALRQDSCELKLIGTTIHESSVAPMFSDVFEKAPMTNDEGYFTWLEEIISKHSVDMIIPSIESDVFAWNENREFLSLMRAFPLLNSSRLISLCKDKWLFYKELMEYSSPYVIESTVDLESKNISFPVLLKPRRGYASQGIVIVDDMKTLEQYRDQIGSHLIIQPVIGSSEEEYTTSAFFDENSELCAHMTLRRKLSVQGYTEIAHTDNPDGIEEALYSLGDIFKPVGPTNFQFRRDGEQLKLLEINPRISSATSIRSAFGYNESKMCVDYFLYGKKPVQPVLKSGYSVRYVEDAICYDSSYI